MLLYFNPGARRYVRTQGEAQKLGEFKIVDVPVDKNGLMDFLNELWASFDIDLGNATAPAFQALVEDTEELTARVETEQAPVVYNDKHERVLNLDVEDAIHNATPFQLAIYMECIAGKIREHAHGLR